MRFSSIAIKNYRQYRDLTLEFNRGENDLQVIVGDNGTGKTNLLNAFTWCLYGNEPHLGTEDKSKGEPRLNKDVILEMVDAGVLIEDVSVTIEMEVDDELVRVHRKLPVRVTGPTGVIEKKAEEYFSVVRIPSNGKSQVVSPEYADAFINRLLPESIREYFFFDGEQLSNYFSGTRADAIRAAVHSISQIDDVIRMRTRTDATVKALMRNLNKSMPDLSVYTDKIEKYQKIFEIYSEKMQKADERTRERFTQPLRSLMRNCAEFLTSKSWKSNAIRSRGALAIGELRSRPPEGATIGSLESDMWTSRSTRSLCLR